MPIHLTNDPGAGRVSARVDGTEAHNTYTIQDGVMTITHTHVPEAIAGRGVAGALTAAALAHARSQGLKVVPQCGYVAAYVQKHPEYADLVAPSTQR